jgi:hypothetical protein
MKEGFTKEEWLAVYKKVLIEQYADAKYKTQTYDGVMEPYWKGVRDGYHRVLNTLFPGWGNDGRGKEVWLCGDKDEEVLLKNENKATNEN